MTAEPAPSRKLALFYDATVAVTAALLIGFMSMGLFPGLYAAGALGAAAAFLLGYLSLQRGWTALARGTIRYGRLWFWMTVVAGFGLLYGRAEPALFFGGMGTGLTLLFWIGGWTGRRMRAD